MTNDTTTDRADQLIACATCGEDFLHSLRDQLFYEERGYVPPRHCRQCREFRKSQRER